MKIGILTTYILNDIFNGTYNAQDTGLAKALSKMYNNVIIYRLTPISQRRMEGILPGYPDITVHSIPSPSIMKYGVFYPKILDSSLDVLVYFSDLQLMVPFIHTWCKKNDVLLIPYIGALIVSSSIFKKYFSIPQKLINTNIYKKHTCFAKTPYINDILTFLNIKSIIIAHVGLDMSLLNTTFNTADIETLKIKHGFLPEDKIILFIGRMEKYKQPLKMIELFKKVLKQDPSYKLIMIGKGYLSNNVTKEIVENHLTESIRNITSIPNAEIWELYRISNSFINLNDKEIFGMAVLEAMYYNCKVIARSAPGPSYIIEDCINGFLCNSDDEIITAILSSHNFKNSPHKRVIKHFTWESTAKKIKEFSDANIL